MQTTSLSSSFQTTPNISQNSSRKIVYQFSSVGGGWFRGGKRANSHGDDGEPGQLRVGARPPGGAGEVQDHEGQEGDGQGPVPNLLPAHGEGGREESVLTGGEEEEKVSNFQLSDVD